MDLFISNAFAQASPIGGAQGFASFLPFVIIFVIFYFLIIRPQKKKADDEVKMISALEKGDEVYTRSGIIGTITGLTEKLVTLEVADGVKMKFIRDQIGGSTKSIFKTEEAK